MKLGYKSGLVPTDVPLCPFAQGEALSFLFPPSQFSSGRWSQQCGVVLLFPAAVQAGDVGEKSLVGDEG